MNFNEKYTIDNNNVWNKPLWKFLDRYVCPCCNYPTLIGRNSYEICGLCFWEDDGQDENNANEVVGGPNQDYSLTEARNNFVQYLSMYRPADTTAFNRRNKDRIMEIKEIYDNLLKMETKTEMQIFKSELRKARKLEEKSVRDMTK
jgi:hypothetical protein